MKAKTFHWFGVSVALLALSFDSDPVCVAALETFSTDEDASSATSAYQEKWTSVRTVIRGCPPDHVLPCVPKCCDLHYSYGLDRQCTPSPDTFFPVFADCPNMTDAFRAAPLENRYEYFIGNPCNNKYVLDVEEYPEDKHLLLSNGSLWYSGRFLTMEEFCVESVNGTPRVLVCFEEGIRAGLKNIFYSVGLLISIPLLLFTAAVYLGFERFRDVQGKILSSHVICLAIAYSFLVLVQLASENLDKEVCIAAAFIIQFFFVAAFVWLKVFCFDTMRNIYTDYTVSHDVQTAKWEKMKFVYYALYAWYMPAALTIISLIMDFTPTIPESYLKPRFGIRSCWFESDEAALPYFYGPIGVIIFINIIFFILSARKIYSEQKKYTKLKMAESYTTDQDTATPAKIKMYISALKQCIYLFCVMGINWAAEVISWIIGGSDLIWVVTDIFNIFQGLIIFYLFVIKPKNVRTKVLRKLRSFLRCGPCRGSEPEPLSCEYVEAPKRETDQSFGESHLKDIRYIDASVTSLSKL